MDSMFSGRDAIPKKEHLPTSRTQHGVVLYEAFLHCHAVSGCSVRCETLSMPGHLREELLAIAVTCIEIIFLYESRLMFGTNVPRC